MWIGRWVRFVLLSEAEEWPRVSVRGARAVSSFGISGTNAHVILEEPPAPAVAASRRSADAGGCWGCSGCCGVAFGWCVGVVPLVVSGRSEAALCGQAGRLGEFVGSRSGCGVVGCGVFVGVGAFAV